ncbi:MAG TPA: hypothetical protein VLA77_01300 [Candidatus Saccharimonadales bacterium]|nr:hypothetical protein [Candidatus Saccharimonadales bacterium]
MEFSLDSVSELTPISVDEAKKVIGKTSQYSSGESLAVAVLDFTAIARAFLRNVSQFEVLKVTQTRYN